MIGAARLAPTEARQLNIVHVTADYPDAICGDKTAAIKRWVELVDDRFNQQIISLNRISPSFTGLAELLVPGRNPVRSWAQHGNLASVEYAAPARGVLHQTMLLRLADVLSAKLEHLPRPDLLVAHKLTVEGLAVAKVARRLGVPYAVTLQGDSDTKIIMARPDLARQFGKVLADAAVVFAMAPWGLDEVQRRLKVSVRDAVVLPCAVLADTPVSPRLVEGEFASAFHLKNYRRKNFPKLCQAFALAHRQMPGIRLTVYGGGSVELQSRVAGISEQYQAITLAGPVQNGDLPARFNGSTGFVMPSLRETFGMVFLEALFAGCPVIYPAGQAIHGYFEAKSFALPVERNDTGSIADALLQCARDQRHIKAALADWQQSGDAARFQRTTIGTTFAAGLVRAAASSPSYKRITHSSVEHSA